MIKTWWKIRKERAQTRALIAELKSIDATVVILDQRRKYIVYELHRRADFINDDVFMDSLGAL